MIRPIFEKFQHPFFRLLFLGVFIGVCLLFSIMLGIMTGMLIFNVDFSQITAFATLSTPQEVAFAKYFQLISHLGLFIIPGVLFVLVFHGSVKKGLNMHKLPSLLQIAALLVLVFALVPFVSWLVDVNASMKLPGSFENIEFWMRQKENAAEFLTERFLATNSWQGLMVNLFVMAVVPAIGEEIIFRGILLRIFTDWMKNIHWAALITAILFSAMHVQFFGFLPRFFLGLLFAYIFIWSRNLWLPILIHFFNNAMAVVAYFMFENGYFSQNPEQLEKQSITPAALSVSIIFSMFLLFYLWKSSKLISPKIHN